MDRRTLITTAAVLPVSLPLLPVSAFAQPDDPAVAAYREWKDVFDAWCEALRHSIDGDCPAVIAADDAEMAAGQAVAEAIATTPEGIVAQVRFAFSVFGDVSHGGDWHDPSDFTDRSFGHRHGKRLLLSILAGAERMAREDVS